MSDEKLNNNSFRPQRQPTVNNDDDNADPSDNALVIRDGFPALLCVPSGNANAKDAKQLKQKWWIDETDDAMPIPNFSFWSHDEAIKYNQNHLSTLIQDCHQVFTARTREENTSYSAGTTYFLPALMKPRCALEALVKLIFDQHTMQAKVQGRFQPENSGAEWWTLVLGDKDDDKEVRSDEKKINPPKAASAKNKDSTDDNNENDDKDGEKEEEDDDVGWHYDADYGLEDQAPGLLLHPRVGTVTYLSNTGAPTVILDCLTPKQGQVQSLDNQSIDKAWISFPKIGKHMAFDGRLLHGAPSDIFPCLETLQASQCLAVHQDDEPDSKPPPTKKAKVVEEGNTTSNTKQQRVTLLVNIWLNHCPLDAEVLDDEVVAQFKTPWINGKGDNNTNGNSDKSLFSWNNKVDLTQQAKLRDIAMTANTTTATKESKKNYDDDDSVIEDEIVLCNHRVNVSYGATPDDYHSTLLQACMDESSGHATNQKSFALSLKQFGALTLSVGDPVSESEAEGDDGDDEAAE